MIMAAFPYKSILLHAHLDKSGWTIIGIRHNNSQKFIADLDLDIGQELAQQFADKLAKNLAGKPSAEID
jgi:hypothetical protein